MDYNKEFGEEIITGHRLASTYHWSWRDIFGRDISYMEVKELIRLLDLLEVDKNAFLNATEAALYKNTLRLPEYNTKSEE